MRRLALLAGIGVLLAITALTIRTPARAKRWLAEYDSTKHYLAATDANFDWVVARKKLDLPTLDSVTRADVAHSWTSLSAAWIAPASPLCPAARNCRSMVKPRAFGRRRRPPPSLHSPCCSRIRRPS